MGDPAVIALAKVLATNTTVTKLKEKNAMVPQKIKPFTALRDW